MEEKITLTEREKICSNCGGVLETTETSEELWVLEGKDYFVKTFSLKCLQCGKEYTIKKTKNKITSTSHYKNWDA